jgi:hypothetical protein
MRASRLCVAFVIVLLAACASAPPRHGEVVTMRAGEAPNDAAYPAPGTVWRLDENDLKALSPAPLVPAPPPPRRPPPRYPGAFHSPPYYGLPY